MILVLLTAGGVFLAVIYNLFFKKATNDDKKSASANLPRSEAAVSESTPPSRQPAVEVSAKVSVETPIEATVVVPDETWIIEANELTSQSAAPMRQEEPALGSSSILGCTKTLSEIDDTLKRLELRITSVGVQENTLTPDEEKYLLLNTEDLLRAEEFAAPVSTQATTAADEKESAASNEEAANILQLVKSAEADKKVEIAAVAAEAVEKIFFDLAALEKDIVVESASVETQIADAADTVVSTPVKTAPVEEIIQKANVESVAAEVVAQIQSEPEVFASKITHYVSDAAPVKFESVYEPVVEKCEFVRAEPVFSGTPEHKTTPAAAVQVESRLSPEPESEESEATPEETSVVESEEEEEESYIEEFETKNVQLVPAVVEKAPEPVPEVKSVPVEVQSLPVLEVASTPVDMPVEIESKPFQEPEVVAAPSYSLETAPVCNLAAAALESVAEIITESQAAGPAEPLVDALIDVAEEVQEDVPVQKASAIETVVVERSATPEAQLTEAESKTEAIKVPETPDNSPEISVSVDAKKSDVEIADLDEAAASVVDSVINEAVDILEKRITEEKPKTDSSDKAEADLVDLLSSDAASLPGDNLVELLIEPLKADFGTSPAASSTDKAEIQQETLAAAEPLIVDKETSVLVDMGAKQTATASSPERDLLDLDSFVMVPKEKSVTATIDNVYTLIAECQQKSGKEEESGAAVSESTPINSPVASVSTKPPTNEPAATAASIANE